MNELCVKRILLIIFLLMSGYAPLHSQTIVHSNGAALNTKYCYNDTAYVLTGMPAGGTFTGCGLELINGQWILNPAKAAAGVSVFPYPCALQYTVNGQTVKQNILIQKPVIVSPALRDSQTCNGRLQLNAGTLYAGAYQYQWSPSAPILRADTSYTTGYITGTETFRVRVTDVSSGCTGNDSITIFLRPVPQLEVRATQTISARETVQLLASGATSYQWIPATWLDHARRADPVARPQAPITYTVIGANEYGCMDTATLSIQIREELFVPGAFSPNGDGLNDVFAIKNFGYQEIKSFRIFDRWGKEIFSTSNGMTGWNGMIKGSAAPVGTYFYHIELLQRDGSAKILRGDVQLIR